MIKWLRSILEWVKNLFCKKTMRRKITLYIADQLVDLDDQSFILFNYQMDDLSNPTIVKNSFSQQITLKGTANNNRIFGHYFKTDRRISNTGGETGTDFNASQKTPFTIYDEMGHILESGYIKLDSISRQRADIQYKVTLFGGLGSFFYALSYDENGNKRNLASLDYLGTSNPDTELNFTITAQAVQDAWARLRQDTSVSPIWDVINFAPAYNGIPEGNFSPDKALVDPTDVGLQDTITEDNVSYTTQSGYCMVNLAEAQDEWAVKDLRSYLQRPIFSMKAFWDAICNPANNGGYEVDASVVQDYLKFGKYSALWKTLPMITSIGSIQQESGDLSLTMSSTATSGNDIGRFDIVGSVPAGTKVTANLNCKIRFNTPSGANAYTELLRYVSRNAGRNTYAKFSVIFIQAVAYGSDNSVVGGSKIKVFTPLGGRRNGASLASSCGYVPAWSADYETSYANTFTKVSAGVFEMPDEMGFTIEAQDVSYYKIQVSVYSGTYYATAGSSTPPRYSYSGDGSTSVPVMYADYDTGFTPNSAFIIEESSPIPVPVPYTLTQGYASAGGNAEHPAVSFGTLSTRVRTSQIFGSYSVKTKPGYAIRAIITYSPYIETIPPEAPAAVTEREAVSNVQGQTEFTLSNDNKYSIITFCKTDATQDLSPTDDIVDYISTNRNPGSSTITYTSSESLRSGATITKSMLLSSSATPAEYMISFCKIFGLYFTYDVATRKVTILRRNDLYQDETIDLEKRVDLSKGISIQPLVFQAKWYDFILEGVGGAFYDEYLNVEGVPYGIQRVNTGYDFNADSVNLMDSVVFKNACTILARSKYFNYIFQGQVFKPSPFLDKGNTYTLWSADGDTLETDISCPPDSASVTYYNDNPAYKGYDVNEARKLELRTADNKPIDGSDILVFHEGWNNYPYFKVTDDVPAMDVLNEGVPCWLLGAGSGAYIPIFQRYVYGNIHLIEHSLDFGVPKEMDIPGVSIAEGCTIYERGWKKYISDRYDVNTKVMTCRVNFAGIPVTQELLRKFYWYDNSLWVLNAIRNYSLTTFDPVECEFVQVQNKGNYLNGQEY